MKRNGLLVCIFNIFMSVAVMVTVEYALIKYDKAATAPYSMGENAFSFFAFLPDSDRLATDAVLKQIKEQLSPEEVSLVFCGDSTFGMGVYDSRGYLYASSMAQGLTLPEDFFTTNHEWIIAKKGSDVERILGAAGVYSAPMGDFYFAGFYDEDYPLCTAENDYVYPFFLSKNLDGIYTVESDNPQIRQILPSIFIENGYEVSGVTTYRKMNAPTFISYMRDDTFFYSMIICLFFIYGNYAIFVAGLRRRVRRTVRIRRLLGATRLNTLMIFARAYSCAIVSGAIGGAIICAIRYVSISVDVRMSLRIALGLHIPLAFLLSMLSSLTWRNGDDLAEIRL